MSGDERRRMVSDAEVKDFYEKMPYPPPLTTLEEHRELTKTLYAARHSFIFSGLLSRFVKTSRY